MDKRDWIEKEIARVSSVEASEAAEPCAKSARYDEQNKRILVELDNDCMFAFPVGKVQGLEHATEEELSDMELLGGGYAIHWPRVNADIRIESALAGIFGSRKWMMSLAAREAGSRSSSRKAVSSRENGKKGGRPRKVA